jgi:hypothetical protein
MYAHGQAPLPPAPSARNPWPWVAVSVALLAAAAVAIVLILTGGDHEQETAAAGLAAAKPRHGAEDIAGLIDPVGAGNDTLSEELEVLDAGDDPDSALAVVRSARHATTEARRELAALDLSPADDGLRQDTQRALARDLAYLGALRPALRQRSVARVGAARRQAGLARLHWSVVDRDIPGAGGRIAGLVALTAWAEPPTLADGDAGPGPVETAPATDEPASAPATDEVIGCEGYEGIYEITARSVDCAEATTAAMGALNGKSAAAANGFVCGTVAEAEPGTARYECDRNDGAHIGFTVSR